MDHYDCSSPLCPSEMDWSSHYPKIEVPYVSISIVVYHDSLLSIEKLKFLTLAVASGVSRSHWQRCFQISWRLPWKSDPKLRNTFDCVLKRFVKSMHWPWRYVDRLWAFVWFSYISTKTFRCCERTPCDTYRITLKKAKSKRCFSASQIRSLSSVTIVDALSSTSTRSSSYNDTVPHGLRLAHICWQNTRIWLRKVVSCTP